jgi:hypothetical protein
MAAIMQGVNQTSHLDPKGQQSQDVTFFDDFLSYTDGGLFTVADSGSAGSSAWDGTALGANGRGHNLLLTTKTTTQWDYYSLATTNALFLPVATGAAMGCETTIKFTSQAANNAMVYFGFMSTVAIPAGSNVDPTASYSGAIIYRLSGDTQWRIQVSNATTKTTQTTVGSDFICADGQYCLRVDFMPFTGSSVAATNGVSCFASFSINGVQVKDKNNFLVQLPVLYASLAAMKVGVIAQAATANAQTLLVDYIQANVSRGLTIPNG